MRPEAALAALTDGAALVDIRHLEQRITEGEVPGAIIIVRNVLEWRLDPRPRPPDGQIIVMCSQGFASTLAAASLCRIGLHRATYLDGGFRGVESRGPAQSISTKCPAEPGR